MSCSYQDIKTGTYSKLLPFVRAQVSLLLLSVSANRHRFVKKQGKKFKNFSHSVIVSLSICFSPNRPLSTSTLTLSLSLCLFQPSHFNEYAFVNPCKKTFQCVNTNGPIHLQLIWEGPSLKFVRKIFANFGPPPCTICIRNFHSWIISEIQCLSIVLSFYASKLIFNSNITFIRCKYLWWISKNAYVHSSCGPLHPPTPCTQYLRIGQDPLRAYVESTLWMTPYNSHSHLLLTLMFRNP